MHFADESFYTALIKMATPNHGLIGIADVVDRRYLAARKPFLVLTGQYLQLELLTVRAALGTKTINAVRSEMAHQCADPLLRQGLVPRQQLRSAFASQEALNDLELELCFVLLYGTP